MTGASYISVVFVALMTAATVGLGIVATRRSRTASDFFVAGRSVSVFWNASAISGEYLSAASFMGIAGLLMKNGYDALWYPVCYAAGYLFLLLFIAGPLRRFGAYTIPDFAEGRFDSPAFRKVAVTFVLCIGFFYTMPQMKGAGLVMKTILDWPYWAGIVVVGSVITFNVALGGMKGITIVQAFQYWAKVFAISLPVFALASVYGGYGTNLSKVAADPTGSPRVSRDVDLKFKGARDFPANVVAFSPAGPSRLELPDGAEVVARGSTPALKAGEFAGNDLLSVGAEKNSTVVYHHGSERRTFPNGPSPAAESPGGSLALGSSDFETIGASSYIHSKTYPVTAGGGPVMENGLTKTAAGRFEFKEPATARLRAGEFVPNAPPNQKWLSPFGTLTSKHGYPLLYTYSLIIALICGTAGLPHILVRFYTNPDGRAAKRTTLWVMVMLGAFYVFPPVWGVLGRNVMPQLYANNLTDSVVIRLPTALSNPVLGQVLSGITSAGAFAAFMSTFSGLLVSMSGALAHDIYGKMLRPSSSPESRTLAFKVSAVLVGGVSMLLGCFVETFDIAMMVGWAFAIAASSYFPLLLLGSWWRGLTKYGAAGGMLSGGLLSLAAIITSMLLDKKILAWKVGELGRSLLEQPAVWGVPLSLVVMVLVSRATATALPKDVYLKMLRLHAPEELGLSKNYIDQ